MPEDNFCAKCGTRYDPVQVVTGTTVGTPDGQGQPVRATRPDAGGQPPAPPAGYGQYGSPWQPADQPGPGLSAPPNAAPGTAIQQPGYGAGYGMPASAAYGIPQVAALCANCGQAWTGSQACAYCGQVRGLPNGITLSSAGRRFGGYLLDGLLLVVTLVIGWIIWTLVVWAQGQTPAKQILGMRVVRLDRRTYAGWGRMFLRDFVGKLIVGVISSLLLVTEVIALCWLLWDKDRQELWDKIAGTIVVNDPDKRLIPAPPAS
jgi:RDD family